MMTAAKKAEIDAAQDTDEKRVVEYKKEKKLNDNKSALLNADAGDYVLYVEAASATVKGGACFNVTVAPYTESEVKAMLSMAPEAKTEIAYVGDTNTATKVAAALKAPAFKAPADVTGLTVTAGAAKYYVVSGGSLTDADTAPNAEGTYRVVYTTVEQKNGNVINVPSVEYSYNFTVKKMGFVFDTNIVLDPIANASATDSVKTKFEAQAIAVTDGNGTGLTKNTEYEITNVKYFKPDGSADDGNTVLNKAAGNWKVTYDVKGKTGYDFYLTTSGTMTIPVGKAASSVALTLDFTANAFPQTFDYGSMPADFLKNLNAALDNVKVKADGQAITDYTVKCVYTDTKGEAVSYTHPFTV